MITFLRRWFTSEPEAIDEEVEQQEPEPKKPHCVFIHGANQSRLCWNYIITQLQLQPDDYTAIEYSTLNAFYDNLTELQDLVKDIPDGSVMISHSLGGLYALHLHKHYPDKFSQSISISTPFRGSTAAEYLRYLSPQTKLFRDIGKRSKPVVEANQMKVTIPWTQIVSVRGNSPWLSGANDGIVTVDSQRHRTDVEYVAVDANHYEILVSNRTVDAIKNRL